MTAGWPAAMSGDVAWIVVIGAPLAAAALLAVPLLRPAVLRLAPWTATPAIVLALRAEGDASGVLETVLLGARFAADPLARVFLLFSGVLWLLGGVYARGALRSDRRQARFFAFFLVAMAGNLGLIAAQDMASFYALFALMTFASYGLVLHSGSSEARRASVVYIVMAVLGEAALFAAMVLLATASDTMLFDAVAFAAVADMEGQLAVVLALIGLGVKAGVFGLHMWLPLAHPAAPTPASAVLSGAMIKAGVVGWLRFLPVGEVDLPEIGAVVVVFGLVAAFGAVAVGLTQANPKTVLAYSSVSQMGLITIALGAGLMSANAWLASSTAVLLYALHHGLAKGALFLGVGVAVNPPASTWSKALMRAGLLLPAAALAGLPLTSGAVAKTALKGVLSPIDSGLIADILAWLLPLTAVGTTVLMGRFLTLVWRPPERRPAHPAPLAMTGSWALLVALSCVVVWRWPGWLVPPVVDKTLDPGAAWSATWPALAGIALIGVVAASPGLRAALGRLSIPAGDVLAAVLRLTVAALRYGAPVVARCREAFDSTAARWRARMTTLLSPLIGK